MHCRQGLIEMSAEQNTRILIVDDEPDICRLLERFLVSDGYSCTTAASAKEALQLLASEPYDLLISDIMMPGMSGIEMLIELRALYPDLAVIMVTGLDDRKTGIEALKLGAYGYVTKPFDRNEISINVAGAVQRRRLTIISQQYEHVLEAQVLERTRQIREREREIVIRLISAAAFRDNETGAHIRRIGLYSSAMARDLGWPIDAVADIQMAASMHDVGKIGIPDRVLRKPGALTKEELELIREHTVIGARMLSGSDVPLLRMAEQIALAHHERWDGSGYPSGMAGEEIPESARIVSVADVYDALVHDRVYKSAFSEEAAVAIMLKERGKHFDPAILDCFLRVLPEIRCIRAEVQEESVEDLAFYAQWLANGNKRPCERTTEIFSVTGSSRA